MNTQLFFAILISFIPSMQLAVDSYPQKTKPNKDYQRNLSTYNLKGKVKSIKEVNYQQWVTEDMLRVYITRENFEFDKAGNLSHITTFLQKDAFSNDYKYTYDEVGNYTQIKDYEKDGTPGFIANYLFDEKGRMYDQAHYRGDHPTYRQIHQYETTSNGYIERIKFGPNMPFDDLIRKYSFYKEKNESIYETFVENINTPYFSKTVSKFDQNENPIEVHSFDKGEKFFSSKFLSYNQNNQCISIKSIGDISNKVLNFEEYRAFDSYNNEIEYKRVEFSIISKKSYRTKYTYDKRGNWIRKETFLFDGANRTSVERVIEYY